MNSIGANTNEERALYGPAALLNAFGNSLTTPLLNKVLTIKGIYRKGKGVIYSGYYYDILKDEFTDSALTLVVPEAIRRNLIEGQVIEGYGYLSKRLSVSSGRIDLLLTLTDLLSRKDRAADEDEIRSLKLIQQKAQAGYKDIDQLIKIKLYQQLPVTVTILMGITAIVDNDIKHQLKEAAVVYNIRYKKVNLTRPADIIKAMQEEDGPDILVITRGGGDNIQIFNNPEICEQALSLRSAFITAIGHAADEPLLQKMADKYFITPTALGQYFHDLHTRTMEELSHSKTKLIADIYDQVERQFKAQLQHLSSQLVEANQGMQAAVNEHNNRFKMLNERLSRSRSVNNVLLTLLIVLIAIGLIYWLVIKA